MSPSASNANGEQLVYKSPARAMIESLVRRGLVPPEESAPLLEAARVTRRPPCLLILDLGWLDEKTIAETLVGACNLPYINLDSVTVDSDVLELVSPSLCWERKILPLDRVGDTVTLAMVDTLDDRTATRVMADNHIAVVRAVAVAGELSRAIERHFPNFAKPDAAFGADQAAAALKAARVSLSAAPSRQIAAAGEKLPGWLNDTDDDDAPNAPARKKSNLPGWLDEEPDGPPAAPIAKARPAPKTKAAPKKKAARRRKGGAK